MKKYCLIGKNIEHSLSPSLFQNGYNSSNYEYKLIQTDEFTNGLNIFLNDKDIVAGNITNPFKETCFEYALKQMLEDKAIIDGPCYKIKACNLLVKQDNGLKAYNTDFSGVIMSIAEAYFPNIVKEFYNLYKEKAHIYVHKFCKSQIKTLFPQCPQALIIGCGGAGRAAAIACSELGFETAIMNRTISKAEDMVKDYPEYNFIAVPITDFKNAIRECDLVIYTIPCHINEIDTLDIQDLRGENNSEDYPHKVVIEANYIKPAFEPQNLLNFLYSGAQYFDGRSWLLYQGLVGYQYMTDSLPSLYNMEEALK